MSKYSQLLEVVEEVEEIPDYDFSKEILEIFSYVKKCKDKLELRQIFKNELTSLILKKESLYVTVARDHKIFCGTKSSKGLIEIFFPLRKDSKKKRIQKTFQLIDEDGEVYETRFSPTLNLKKNSYDVIQLVAMIYYIRSTFIDDYENDEQFKNTIKTQDFYQKGKTSINKKSKKLRDMDSHRLLSKGRKLFNKSAGTNGIKKFYEKEKVFQPKNKMIDLTSDEGDGFFYDPSKFSEKISKDKNETISKDDVNFDNVLDTITAIDDLFTSENVLNTLITIDSTEKVDFFQKEMKTAGVHLEGMGKKVQKIYRDSLDKFVEATQIIETEKMIELKRSSFGKDKSESIIERKPESIFERIIERKPESITERNSPERKPESIFERIIERKPESITERNSPERKPESIFERIIEKKPESITERNSPERKPESIFERIIEKKPESIIERNSPEKRSSGMVGKKKKRNTLHGSVLKPKKISKKFHLYKPMNHSLFSGVSREKILMDISDGIVNCGVCTTSIITKGVDDPKYVKCKKCRKFICCSCINGGKYSGIRRYFYCGDCK